MLLEAQLEKQSDNQGISEEMEKVHEQVKSTDDGNLIGTCTAKIYFFVVFLCFKCILCRIFLKTIYRLVKKKNPSQSSLLDH